MSAWSMWLAPATTSCASMRTFPAGHGQLLEHLDHQLEALEQLGAFGVDPLRLTSLGPHSLYLARQTTLLSSKRSLLTRSA